MLVLVVGMLAAQLLTGTIWFDLRYERVQEIPARLAGARIGQALRLLDARPELANDPSLLGGDDFRIETLSNPAPPSTPDSEQRDVERLMADALAHENAAPWTLTLRDVRLYDDASRPGKHRAIYTATHPRVDYIADVTDAGGHGYRVHVSQGEAGLHLNPFKALGEYALRVYGLRTALILLLALLLVRWVTRPLTRLSQAAKTLGHHLRAPPLPLRGPREVRDAAEAFNTMQARLARAIESRDELLGAVSHDLRTPITRMRLRTEMVADVEARERLRHELAQMQGLVDSILDYLAAGAAPASSRPVDLTALVQAVTEDARDAGQDVVFEEGSGDVVEGDAQGLRRALTNLVDNAVRHGYRARIHVEGRRVIIDDDGPGIPADDLDHVLEPFFRLDRSRRDGVPGSGLGLSIARQLVQAQGGTLGLANRCDTEGRVIGLRATMTLPG